MRSTVKARAGGGVLVAVIACLIVAASQAASAETLPGDVPGPPLWPPEPVPAGTSETYVDMRPDGSYFDPSVGRRVAARMPSRDVSPGLTRVAHVYSENVGTVQCATPADWEADVASIAGWAYTNLRDEHAVLGPLACEGAQSVGSATVPLWQQALGALALTHEAFHLRRWRFRRNEGKVSCQALVHFQGAVQRLGADAAHASLLYPYALALHAYQTRLFSQYRDPACVIPPWAPPSR